MRVEEGAVLNARLARFTSNYLIWMVGPVGLEPTTNGL